MKLVLLDRDGVINADRPDSVKSRDEFTLLPHVGRAIRLLNEAALPVAIVTNQSVVGRNVLSCEELKDIHTYLNELLTESGAYIDMIYTCTSADPHHPDRKPNPGLLLKAFRDFQVEPKDAVLIGDALRDLEAAYEVSCPRILVRTGKGEETLEKGLPNEILPVTIFNDLFEAVQHLLHEKR